MTCYSHACMGDEHAGGPDPAPAGGGAGTGTNDDSSWCTGHGTWTYVHGSDDAPSTSWCMRAPEL